MWRIGWTRHTSQSGKYVSSVWHKLRPFVLGDENSTMRFLYNIHWHQCDAHGFVLFFVTTTLWFHWHIWFSLLINIYKCRNVLPFNAKYTASSMQTHIHPLIHIYCRDNLAQEHAHKLDTDSTPNSGLAHCVTMPLFRF